LPFVEHKELKKQELFCEEGERSYEFAFVVNSTFRQFYTKDGEERSTCFYFSNDLLCAYVNCIKDASSILSIQASTDATLRCFPIRLSRIYTR